MDVSIIIVNYNTCKLTCDCIESVRKFTKRISYEIIVVDNASTDGSREVFSNIEDIRYIYSEENLGFGKANNLGYGYATGRNILFLNSDTLLISDAISTMSEYLDNNEKCGGVGVNLIKGDGRPTLSFSMMRPSIFREINDFLQHVPARWIYGKYRSYNYNKAPKKVKQIIGADLMVRKSILEKFEFVFNPAFFLFLEETELCFRINKLGYSLEVLSTEKIVHLEGQSTTWDVNRMRTYLKSRHTYYSLTHGRLYHCIANFFWYLTIYSRILVLDKKKKDRWLKYASIEKELAAEKRHTK